MIDLGKCTLRKPMCTVSLFLILILVGQSVSGQSLNKAIQLLKNKQSERALVILDSLLVQEESNIDYLLERGLAHKQLKHYGRAEADYLKALNIGQGRGNGLVYNRLGGLYFIQLDYDKSLFYYNEAIKKNPFDDFYYVNRGLVFEARKDTAMALRDFEYARKINKENSVAWFGVAREFRKRNEFDKAKLILEEGLKGIGDIEFYVELGLNAYFRGDLKKAQQLFELFLKDTDKSHARYYRVNYFMGEALLFQSQYDQAIVYYQTVIDHEYHRQSLNNIGWCYIQKQDYKTAFNYLEKVEEKDRGDAYLQNNFAMCYYDQGDYQAALKSSLFSVELNNKNAYSYVTLGQIQLKLKNKEAACKSFEQAEKLKYEGLELMKLKKKACK